MKKLYTLLTTLLTFLGIYTFCHKYFLENIEKLSPAIILLLLVVLSLGLALSVEVSYFIKKKQNRIYKLFCRFESLIESVKNKDCKILSFIKVRNKPWFNDYNSCVEQFKVLCPDEYKQTNLEPLPLKEVDGSDGFTNEKLPTLLQQSEIIFAILKGLLPPEYKKQI